MYPCFENRGQLATCYRSEVVNQLKETKVQLAEL